MCVQDPSNSVDRQIHRVHYFPCCCIYKQYRRSCIPVPPATPTSLEVVKVTPDSVTLAWRYRDLTPADSYSISYAPSNSPLELTSIDGITDTLYTIENLTPRTEYVFQVSATNSAGQGESNEIIAMTHFGKTSPIGPLSYCV